MPKTPKQKQKRSAVLRNLVVLAMLVIALYVIIPQLEQFDTAFDAAMSADPWLLVCAGLMIMGAIAAAALVYVCLALKRIRYRKSFTIQVAGMFVNRLLPAGIGGMGLSADFLYRSKHSLTIATLIVLLNNLLTFVGHMTLLAVAVLVFGITAPSFDLPDVSYWVWAGGIGIATILLVLFWRKAISVAAKITADIQKLVQIYRRFPHKIIGAYVAAMCNTAGHAAAIACCMYAFGLDLSPVIALVVLTGGVAVASVTPTPGGLLGAEAGLTAVLVGYGVDLGTALAIALSYRLVSYWLPLLPGVYAFWYANKKRLI